MANFGSLVVALNANISGFSRGMGQAQSVLGGFSKTMNSLGGGLALAGIGYAVASEVSQFAEFEDAMLRVKAITRATSDEMKLLTERTHELAKKSGVSQDSIWKIMLDLGRANFNPEEINSVAEAVVLLTKATGSDPTRTGEILGSMINAFSLGAGDAISVADKLTAAANKSQTSVEELGDAMAYVGPIGKDIGVTMDETLAMMGVLGNFNIRGSMAGTSTRRLFALMSTDSKRMGEIFGQSFTDINGNFIGVTAAMKIMADATKDMAAPERLAKFNEAFGMLGVASASTLAGMITQYAELKTAIENSAGESLEASETMESGVGGSLRRLMATWTEFKTQLIGGWSETLIWMMDNLSSWVSNAQNLFTEMALGVIVSWQWLGEEISAATDWMTGLIASGFMYVWDTISNILAWIIEAAPAAFYNFGGFWVEGTKNIVKNFVIFGQNVKAIFSEIWDYIASGGTKAFEPDVKPFVSALDGLVTKELPKFENKMSGVTEDIMQKTRDAADRMSKNTLQDRMNDAFLTYEEMKAVKPAAPEWQPRDPADRGKQFSPFQGTPEVTGGTVKTGPTAELGLRGTAKAYDIIMKAREGKQLKLLEQIANNTAKTANPVRPGFTGEIAEGLIQ